MRCSRIAVVVVVDGLRVDALGCYGNSRAETPFLDRLAAESAVYDFAYCLDGTLEGFYGAALHGVHPVYRPEIGLLLPRAAPNQSTPAGVCGTPPANVLGDARHLLCSDDAAVARLDGGHWRWSEGDVLVVGEPRGAGPHRGRFLNAAAEWLNHRWGAGATGCTIAWVHTRVLPRETFDDGTGDLREVRRRYDAAVTQLDADLRTLFTQLTFPDEVSGVLFVVAGARGVSLGERGGIGVEPVALHEELLHVPLVVHASECASDACRTARLASPLDLHAVLSQWSLGRPALEAFGDITCGDAAGEWLLFVNSRGDRAVRTPGWHWIEPAQPFAGGPEWDNRTAPGELYLKPDDRWEFNEIAGRRPEIAAELSTRLADLSAQAAGGMPLRLVALPAELVKGG